MRAALVKAFGLVPPGLKRWVYRHPSLAVPLSRLLGNLVPSDRPVVVTVRGGPNKGARLAIDRNVPRVYWLNEELERDVFDAMRRHVRPGMHVADIGAHIGFATLALSKWVGAGGRVTSFEPDPRTAERFRETMRLNDVRNVTLQQKAVSDRSQTMQFAAQADVTSHLVAPADRTGRASGDDVATIAVESVRLDDVVFADPAPRLDLVKLDAEDFEADVLRGAPRVLDELGPVWLIEVHSPRSLTGCVRELSRHDYRVRALDFTSYYEPAISAVLAGAEAPGDGFERGHVLAVK
jgi:FkbM family methyltransferase